MLTGKIDPEWFYGSRQIGKYDGTWGASYKNIRRHNDQVWHGKIADIFLDIGFTAIDILDPQAHVFGARFGKEMSGVRIT